MALGKILSGESIEIWGDGTSIRDYIYIDDLGKIFCQLIENNVINTEINIGSGKGYSVNDIIAELEAVVSEPVKVEYKPARSADVSTMILSTDRLSKYIDFKLTSLEDGLRLFYKEEKEKLC